MWVVLWEALAPQKPMWSVRILLRLCLSTMCRQGSTPVLRALQEVDHKGVMPMDGVEEDPTKGGLMAPLVCRH